jgi:ATP-dependent helicase/DNAse subunit B
LGKIHVRRPYEVFVSEKIWKNLRLSNQLDCRISHLSKADKNLPLTIVRREIPPDNRKLGPINFSSSSILKKLKSFSNLMRSRRRSKYVKAWFESHGEVDVKLHVFAFTSNFS